ncbi:MAG: hypothetical protein HY974_03025 [Candidatus Kerfeldbacteria bacterium]|nr:hypothetical protein [Candidatus Kerfeldbacteria bacterium]
MTRPARQPASSSRPVIPPPDRRRLVLFILTLVAVTVVGLFTIYYNLRLPVKNGGLDLFQLIAQRFRESPTLPR